MRSKRHRAAAALLAVAFVLPAGCVPGRAPAGVPVAPGAPAGLPAADGAPSAPAPLPAPVALAQARARLLDGDYPKAAQELAAIQAGYPGTPEAAEAAFRLGEAALADDTPAAAEEHLRTFLAAYPDHPRRAVAALMLGRALEQQGNGGAAVFTYQQYEAWAEPGASLADVLHLRAASVYFAAGRAADAWAELGQAAQAADQIGSASARVRVYDALSARYLEAGNGAQAAAALQVVLDGMVEARRPARPIADVAWRLAGLYQGLGRRDLADALRWRIVGEWPRTSAALQAMDAVGASTVPAIQRGIIAFNNQRWAQAVEALAWYLDAGAPEGQQDLARYDLAAALARLGNPAALDALDAVADRHPESGWAAEALWEAGSLLLRRGNLPAAAARFERLAVEYPASRWRGQALYWLGRLLPQFGDVVAGHHYMEAAAGAGHEDFYTFRARAALRRPAPAAKPLAGQEQVTPEERAAWEQWLAARSDQPREAQAERRAQLEQDVRFRRGTVLLEAGFDKPAEEELAEALEAFGGGPDVVAHVALHVRERGMYPYSVTLGHRLLGQVNALGEPSLLAAPKVVQKLVLPLAYWRLIEPAARAKRVDPLLLLGLVKQESWFQPKAESGANARGLTQFIPETARDVAAELEWPNWTWDDMTRPYVAVPFGAHYLSTLIRDFRGNYHLALAGYNGGPGNVLRWARGDWHRDLDLFVEEIGFAETRAYVKAVAGNYELYKAIYYG